MAKRFILKMPRFHQYFLKRIWCTLYLCHISETVGYDRTTNLISEVELVNIQAYQACYHS